ncbi:hypothetical protein RN001_009792 [Aquatica leii]|uniref:RING-type domain-containing protein n=1 Tax=Aquatica leii TaxID=1421715 RepID=A0AAN7P8G0_9COLE|nr:hypothetical protein RN001_009792 [Aquatica leii]
MFRRNKKENKAKLEHKLYLARENPEPVFDVSDCGISDVPSGIYSLCKVFLKQSLHLEHNRLSSLSGGGNLKDLCLLKVLDIHDNAFVTIPQDIGFLTNLLELYLNDNHIKKLPSSICGLKKLQILDLSNNMLKDLPEDLGNLTNLRRLSIQENKISRLPKSLSGAQRIQDIIVTTSNLVYPPTEVANEGTESIMRYICQDCGIEYVHPSSLEDAKIDLESKDTVDAFEDSFKAKIWNLEKIKEQKLQDFLEIEKRNELHQRQEFELATAMKANREKLLTDISEQQLKFDLELAKVQQMKDTDRFRLIEQLQEVEQNADFAIKQLLALNREPLTQLLEQEKIEEERLIAAANQYNQKLCKEDVLLAMQELLDQETKKFAKYNESRTETTKSILEQEVQSDSHLLDVLQNQGLHKAQLISQLQDDVDLQKAAVGALLEIGDARSWGLVQQVRMVESQLAALTNIELNRRKLKMDDQLTDLSEKRCQLSMMLMDLLEQQAERRTQLLSTLKSMEASKKIEDFWLCQYQQLLERIPHSISEAQKNIDPRLGSALLMSGVLHCLPFLAHLAQTEGDVANISEEELENAGVINARERSRILEAFHSYLKQCALSEPTAIVPSAPVLEAASASESKTVAKTSESECVICMDAYCEVIFVPCGHLCCCFNCADPLHDCPMCRGEIERKIRVYSN